MGASDDALWDVVVVGGGPAGMTAAGRAAERGLRVILLEKNHVLGRKLVLTGGGRCNITNAVTNRHVLTGKYGKNGVHLHSLFARFGPDETRALFDRYGLATKVEAEGRVFPVTDNAVSVRAALESYMSDGGVAIRRNCAVASLVTADDSPRTVRAVQTKRGEIIAGREFVLSTGGTARPDTGSTGDALPWLSRLGVAVRVAESALVPIRVSDRWVTELQGLAIQDAELIAQTVPPVKDGPPAGPAGNDGPDAYNEAFWANGKRRVIRRGKLLFTHFGLSGPAALNSSAELEELAGTTPFRLLINPRPDTDPAETDRYILTAVAERGKKTVGKLLSELVAPRLARGICTVAGIPADQKLATLSRDGRRTIVSRLTGIPCRYDGLMGRDKAVVSSGGVHPSEVDFRTMRLRKVPNVYVLGDLLDFNRQSGGYSLQICWAGGWVAGDACGG